MEEEMTAMPQNRVPSGSAQLITYPDSLGGSLNTLHHLLETRLADIFPGGVHILPPFPSSGDRGFSPLTYFEIDPQFGSWDDIRRIGAQFPVMLDLMVNHISRRSPFFQDFLQYGRSSPYATMFITLDKIWPKREPPEADVRQIFLRRPEHPFYEVVTASTGARERVWATFGGQGEVEQIDLDVHSEAARQLFRSILAHFSRSGVSQLRLDAIAYVIKKPGTSCFFVEPEIYAFLDWMAEEARSAGILLLPEVHAHYSIQEKLAQYGCWVYNFVLPLLVLHTLTSGSARALKTHLADCPRRQFTMLDCHDGIPVQPDIDDVISLDEAQAVVDLCLRRGANVSRIFSAAHLRRPDFDAHQINCTYYSALGQDDQAYILARAIQLFAPGIPQIYYVGLLAGENAPEEVTRTGAGRAINRRNYTLPEVEQALTKPVVQRLLELVRFRNTYPAFAGEFQVLPGEDHLLRLAWQAGAAQCTLHADLRTLACEILYQGEAGQMHRFTP
jgi:sucrose 6(F)-phosphate phosphorylase